MTCKEVMTANPSYCLPGDSVANAAQIMKREDVGPVLVVSDNADKRLVGIVTDRDLAVKIVAEGRDPHNTRIDEVMSSNPVTCNPDDSLSEAMRIMSDYQVRRIPIVDDDHRLVGIVAQADIARTGDDEQVGEMVEEISQPYGAGGWTGAGGREDYDYEGAAAGGRSTLVACSIGFGIGVGLMYLMDPNAGRRRRAVLRDKTTSLVHTSGDQIQKTGMDWRNRARGVVAGTRSKLRHDEVDDPTLEQRVRSKMGREVSHPHAIQITATNGHVTVSGDVLTSEADALLRRVRGVPGVQSVEDRLQRFDSPNGHPSLQGGRHRRGQNGGWGSGARILASAVGGGLLLYGLKQKGMMRKASTTAGMGLLSRGMGGETLSGIRERFL